MSAIALVALRHGVAVTGCDLQPGGASDALRMGATVTEGHDPDHIQGIRALVYSTAVPADHPELKAARRAGIPVLTRAEALAQIVAGGTVVGVAGTHGKTTTTAMVTAALVGAGKDPTGIVGGRVALWEGNVRFGGDPLFVVEADEYDRSFLHLHPTVALVINVEADHLECYGSVRDLEAAFVQFAGRADRALVGTDDGGAQRVGTRLGVPVWRVGAAANADVRMTDIVRAADRNAASVCLPDGRTVKLTLQVPGLHNLRNATMALAAAAALDADIDGALMGLAAFKGVGRRFEHIADVGGVTVIDDYAHHPTEVAATIGAARQRYPKARLIAVFQPHLYSRTQSMGKAMGIALSVADVAVVTDIYPARERPIPGVTGELVSRAARRAGAEVEWVPDRDAIIPRLEELVVPGDVVLTLGAGDITEVAREFVRRREGVAA
jgi:UDP-N-acetylmuramate--alanine ligase